MGPVTFNIKNTSGYTLVVDNNTYGICATVHPNTDAVLHFTPADTNMTNAMRFYAASDPGFTACVLQASVSWSAGGSGADPGWQQPSIIGCSGDMNGAGFGGASEGWQELQPYNLMANGGVVNVEYHNA